MPMIESRFEEEKIQFNVKTTTGEPMEPFNLAKEADFEEISVLCVAGDDNTF